MVPVCGNGVRLYYDGEEQDAIEAFRAYMKRSGVAFRSIGLRPVADSDELDHIQQLEPV